MVVCDDDQLAAAVRQLHGQGQDPQRRYWFPMVGFNYRMTNIEAAIGLAQLERIDWHLARRREIAGWYREGSAKRTGSSSRLRSHGRKSAFWIMCAVLDEQRFGQRDASWRPSMRPGSRRGRSSTRCTRCRCTGDCNEGKTFPVAEDLGAPRRQFALVGDADTRGRGLRVARSCGA